MKKQPISNPFKSANHRLALKILCLAVANQQCSYSTVQKKCKRNSVFFFLCSRENSTKSPHEILSKRSRIFVESNEISLSSWRDFVGAKIRSCEISQWRKFALAKFRQGENSQLRNSHEAKFCWQWGRVVMKTFCSDRFKPLARVIYLVQTSFARAALEVRVFM